MPDPQTYLDKLEQRARRRSRIRAWRGAATAAWFLIAAGITGQADAGEPIAAKGVALAIITGLAIVWAWGE